MNANETMLLIRRTNEGTKTFLFHINLTLIPLGLVLNTFSMIVFTKKKFRDLKIGTFYRVITFLDILALLWSFLLYYTPAINNDFKVWSDLTCKLAGYFLRFGLQISSWLNLFLTVDRFLIVKYMGQKFRFLDNPLFIILIILCIILFIALINMLSFWFRVFDKPGFNIYNKVCSAEPTLMLIRDMIAFD